MPIRVTNLPRKVMMLTPWPQNDPGLCFLRATTAPRIKEGKGSEEREKRDRKDAKND